MKPASKYFPTTPYKGRFLTHPDVLQPNGTVNYFSYFIVLPENYATYCTIVQQSIPVVPWVQLHIVPSF